MTAPISPTGPIGGAGSPGGGPSEVSPTPWYRLSPSQTADRLGVELQSGLSSAEVLESRERSGPNELLSEPKRPWWLRLVDQFRSVLILLLLVAALISAAVGDLKDPIVIGLVVIINAILGFVQEQRADQAMEALSTMLTTQARVRRDGAVNEVPSSEVVPGDVVLLRAGDRIPADGRFVRATSLAVDESTLTGESVPVDKDTEAIELPDHPSADGYGAAAQLELAERSNVGHMNTTVVRGTAELVVTDTGMSTEIGRLAGMI